jgi:septal ring factor EnvC (AmiA/AmiB activator)
MSNNNNTVEEEDKYEYVTYSNKYFCDEIVKVLEVAEPDNFENFLPSPILDIEKHEKQINKIQEQIDEIEEIRDQFYDQLIEFKMQMKNLSNNNNNNNNYSNIMEKINETQKQLDYLTDELEILLNQRIILTKNT